MGKGNHNDFENELSIIAQEEAALSKKKRKILIKCSHQGQNSGKLKVEFIGDPEKGVARCKKCGAIFNMKPIPDDTLKEAIKVVNDAIQQIRCLADVENDGTLIKTLGQIGFNVQEIDSLYVRILDYYARGKKKNKNKHKGGNESIGFFGNKSFMGSYGKK